MPAEYTECVKSYLKKGVSKDVAQARCAAAYYKKHGVTVKDAAKKEGIAMDFDYDDEFMMAIFEGRAVKVVAAAVDKKMDVWAKSETLIHPTVVDEDIFELDMTLPGAKANCSDGTQLTWTKDALAKYAHTWTGGTVSVNHQYDLIGSQGVIIKAWWDDEKNKAKSLVKTSKLIANYARTHPNEYGVSIEATKIKYNEALEITDYEGSGVGFIFPPFVPQCTPEEGCMVVACETEIKEIVNTNEAEKMANETQDAVASVTPTEPQTATAAEKVSPCEHKKVVAEKDALAAKVADLEKELNDYKMKEREIFVAKLAEKIDITPYKDADMNTLKLVASVVEATEKKRADSTIEFSGATAIASQPADNDLVIAGYSREEIEEYKKNFKK